MLKLDFCDKFLAEIDNYFASGLPIRRPNSMNNYGLIVNEIGMEPSITALQQACTCDCVCIVCIFGICIVMLCACAMHAYTYMCMCVYDTHIHIRYRHKL